MVSTPQLNAKERNFLALIEQQSAEILASPAWMARLCKSAGIDRSEIEQRMALNPNFREAVEEAREKIEEEIKEAPHVGAVVKMLCERFHTSQRSLAGKIGMDASNFNTCLSGPEERTFSEDQFTALLQKLPISAKVQTAALAKFKNEKKLLSLRGRGDLPQKLDSETPLCTMIRFLRIRKLWTEQEAADACELFLSGYNHMEEERATPEQPLIWKLTPWESIKYICTVLGAHPAEMDIIKKRYIAERRPFLESEIPVERTGFGKALTDIRIDEGQSQREAAAALGFQQADLSRWEANKRQPRFPVLLRYAEAYQLGELKREELRESWRDWKSSQASPGELPQGRTP